MTRTDAFSISAQEPMEGKQYVQRCHTIVVATDIEDAIRSFKAMHPAAILWTVSHRGQVEVITSDAIEARRQP